MDSNAGALFGFLLLVSLTIVCFAALCFREARLAKICAGILASYLAVATLFAALTPRTVVNVGDGYCWDTWCAGVEQVSSQAQGNAVLYTLRVQLFSDANHVSAWRAKDFLSVVDDQGRRFSVFQDPGAVPLNVAFAPKDTVETSLSFIAPANSRKLYLTGNELSMPWVYFYFGSDLNPLHPRTLLRVL